MIGYNDKNASDTENLQCCLSWDDVGSRTPSKLCGFIIIGSYIQSGYILSWHQSKLHRFWFFTMIIFP